MRRQRGLERGLERGLARRPGGGGVAVGARGRIVVLARGSWRGDFVVVVVGADVAVVGIGIGGGALDPGPNVPRGRNCPNCTVGVERAGGGVGG